MHIYENSYCTLCNIFPKRARWAQVQSKLQSTKKKKNTNLSSIFLLLIARLTVATTVRIFPFNHSHACSWDWENCCYKWYTEIFCPHVKVNSPLFAFPLSKQILCSQIPVIKSRWKCKWFLNKGFLLLLESYAETKIIEECHILSLHFPLSF